MEEKYFTKNINYPESKTVDFYTNNGGYKAWETVLKEWSTDQLIDEVKKSGLRGRGGAGTSLCSS